jgi:hypothetical protein
VTQIHELLNLYIVCEILLAGGQAKSKCYQCGYATNLTEGETLLSMIQKVPLTTLSVNISEVCAAPKIHPNYLMACYFLTMKNKASCNDPFDYTTESGLGTCEGEWCYVSVFI